MKKELKKQYTIYVLTILIITVLIYTFYFADIWRSEQGIETPESEYKEEPLLGPEIVNCEYLGCPAGTQFVGSSGSNVYHECHCSYAIAILPDNRVCFMNATEAEDKEYRKATVC